MNTISCIMNLFNKSDNKPRSFLYNEYYQKKGSFEDEFLQDHHLIVASDLFLKEIELKSVVGRSVVVVAFVFLLRRCVITCGVIVVVLVSDI